LLRELRVNGGQVLADQVVYALADQEMPRSNGNNILNYPPHRSGSNVTVSATWVELRTNKAWRATVSAPVSSFVLEPATSGIRMAPVFGPNGLLILTSDPIPTSATDIAKVDVAKACGTREPTADFDETRDAQIVGVADMRSFEVPAVSAPECPLAN
jgi:hypothetical protein